MAKVFEDLSEEQQAQEDATRDAHPHKRWAQREADSGDEIEVPPGFLPPYQCKFTLQTVIMLISCALEPWDMSLVPFVVP